MPTFTYQKTLLHKIAESLQCYLKMEVLLSSDYCTVSKTMLLITLSRLPFRVDLFSADANSAIRG